MQTERVIEKFLVIPRHGPKGWRWLVTAKVRETLHARFGYTGGFGEHGPVSSCWKYKELV